MDPFALAIELAVQERHDVQPMPDLRPDDGVDQPDLLLQFATQRLDVVFAGLQPAAGQRPTGRRGELEAHEQHPVVGVDHQGAHRLADAETGRRIGTRASGVR